jgi:hypothetical protein
VPILKENQALYPKDWPAISLRIRFGRAEGRCEWQDDGNRCTALHGLPHPVTGAKVVLTTMHLDHDPSNCEDDNLLAACQMHHNRYDRVHRNETRQRRMREAKGTELFEEVEANRA